MVRCFKAFFRARPCYFLLVFGLLLLSYFEIMANFDCKQRLRELKSALSSAPSVQQHLQAPHQDQPDCCPSRKKTSQRLGWFTRRTKSDDLKSQPATTTSLEQRNYLTLPHPSFIFPHFNSSFGTQGIRNIDRIYLKYLQSRFKSNNSFVIGVPTVKRPNDTIYLYDMLNSLFRAIEDKERLTTLVVLFIAELNDTEFINSTIQKVQSLYGRELNEGLLDVVVPDPKYYPNMDTQVEDDVIFRDPKDRVKWRTKQNYDVSYLMAYAQPRGKYYLQLEDDILTRDRFLTNIRSFIAERSKLNWFMMDFSELGFIGKVFKSSDLILCINFFLLFSTKQPIDLLIIKLLETKACDLNKKPLIPFMNFKEECVKAIAKIRLRYGVSLFQHIGVKSSLQGKTQPLKDRFFKEFSGSDNHKNPPAKVSSTFKHYLDYNAGGIYNNQMFFWGFGPDESQYILIEFEKPELIKRCLIRTSNSIHPLDMLTNDTVVEIKLHSSVVPSNIKYTLQQDGFLRVGHFDLKGTFNHTFNQPALGAISELRIKVIQSIASHWVLIEELKLYV